MIADALAPALDAGQIEKLIEVPPSDLLGDFAFPCFSLAKVLRKSPQVIAEELKAKLLAKPGIASIQTASGYCNLFIDRTVYAQGVLNAVARPDFGQGSGQKRMVVEFASPNTNKPLHLGHLRNMAIGESVSRILEYCGNNVVRTSISNDRGVHICKSMLAYQRLGNCATPQSTNKKSDHFVGDYYVLFGKNCTVDESWNDAAQKMLLAWEQGDPQIRALWKTMNAWAFDGFAKTFALFGIRFDKEYYESDIFTKGKEIVEEGLDRGLFARRDDGAVVVDLASDGFGEKVLLRNDGTSVYIVQDLYLATLKHQEFNYDTSIYVVGNEQNHHFGMLVAILKKLGVPIADRIHHLSYGMVELPEGKMKSREGTVVDADDLIADTQSLAREELVQRYTLTDEILAQRSLRIALAAIKFPLLRIETGKNMVFDPKKAISFEGDTGPYLLYSYARASSILRKSGYNADAPYTITAVDPAEFALLRAIASFPEVVASAATRLSPSVIAGYTFELAQRFSEFYHHCPVLKSDVREFRLAQVAAFRTVMLRCLHLLGIAEIEEM